MNEQNIDGKGMIFGRLATYTAKRALLGEKVNIYNCEEIIITGSKQKLLEKYPKKAKFTGQMGRGPFRPRRSDLFLKRHMRNMLPYKKARGKEAMARIKFIIGNPENKTELKRLEHADSKKLVTQKYLKIKELIKLLGGKS
ncbi:50S ribosomal protein L13 [Candidatus Woesearchaeota archaeon]|nr:50S ribosomal protein L13 [Candidatus Woesearchaeota archaeon]MBW2978529.1 50S ribosomal protein L13 [Candidatus Woesearchaeota archaeon]